MCNGDICHVAMQWNVKKRKPLWKLMCFWSEGWHGPSSVSTLSCRCLDAQLKLQSLTALAPRRKSFVKQYWMEMSVTLTSSEKLKKYSNLSGSSNVFDRTRQNLNFVDEVTVRDYPLQSNETWLKHCKLPGSSIVFSQGKGRVVVNRASYFCGPFRMGLTR